MLATAQPLTPDTISAQDVSASLGELLIAQGQLDSKSLERGRRLAAESGTRLDTVLTQLGLVSERTMAEAMAKLLGLKLVVAADYPQAPALPERLRQKFLRKARAIPIALDERTITVAMADPLDGFAVSAIAIASGRKVEVRVAFPIDLEAALDRLYREEETPAEGGIDELASSAGAIVEE